MDVSIIIVSWNVKELLSRCVRSIQRASGALMIEIVVVDNASSDGSIEMLASDYPDVRVIRMGRNAGYAAACNAGIRKTQGRYIFILNPDTELHQQALQRLVHFADRHHEVGMIGPRINNVDGTFQVGSVRSDPTVSSQVLLKFLHFGSVWEKISALRDYYQLDFDILKTQSVQQIMGAAMFIRKSAFDSVGLLDERFFIWFEDVDLCMRFRQAHYTIVYLPDAEVIHRGNESFKQEATVRKQWYYNSSLIKYMYKYNGFGAALIFILLLPINIAGAFLHQSIVKKNG